MEVNTNGRGVAAISESVVKEPVGEGYIYGDYVLSMAAQADDIPLWGTYPAARDRKLRDFWPTEPILASALFTTIARYVAFGYTLRGPDRQVDIYNNVLEGAEFGGGWQTFATKMLLDCFTQDNAAWAEIIRTEDDPRAPVVSLKHLDSGRCVRTGRAKEPIIYYDLEGNGHLMKWYQVMEWNEFPSPHEYARGSQYCALTRILKASQVMRDILVYMSEKMSGRFHRAIHIVGGIQHKTISDAMNANRFDADSSGLRRFVLPVVIAALDPTKTVSKETIELASLPDGFDYDVQLKWYINQLALGFGADYQDYAPLPGGGLGSAQQSEILHLKARGKGPRLFMKMVENKFNYHGILPRSVKMFYGDQDIAEDMQNARLRLTRAQERAVRIKSNEITPEMARQLAADAGDLDGRYLMAVGEPDITPDQPLDEIFEHEDTTPVPKLTAPPKGTPKPVTKTGGGAKS